MVQHRFGREDGKPYTLGNEFDNQHDQWDSNPALNGPNREHITARSRGASQKKKRKYVKSTAQCKRNSIKKNPKCALN